MAEAEIALSWRYRQIAAKHGAALAGYDGLYIDDESCMQPERLSRITIDDAQCGGRPCIRGMRIRVSDVLDLLGSGASFDEILEHYPYLEREDILAAIQYAALQTSHPILRSA